MAKVIRLTESDLTRIVRRVMNEMEDTTSDVEKTNAIPTNILIGDSQTPYVDMNTTKASRISNVGGVSSLWLGGMGVPWLIDAVNAYPKIENSVKNVITVIGTNGNFGRVFGDDIGALFDAIKTKFPNARILVVQGSWGWGGLKNTTEEQVRKYYKKYKELGGRLIEPPIGNIEPHQNHPNYEKIGASLDSIL